MEAGRDGGRERRREGGDITLETLVLNRYISYISILL